MNSSQPFSKTTCFRLRTPPLGFDSASPWKIGAQSAPSTSRPVANWDRAEQPARLKSRGAARWVALGVFALLATYATLAWTASLSKGTSFDESLQLAVGYNIWLHGDYRVEGANGDLVKRWATLPYLFSRPNFLSRSDPLWQAPDSYELGRRFFFGLGNRPESLLWQGRAMVTLLGVATGFLVFACGRQHFGPQGGVLALALFVTSSHMLAFGGIVSTDMSIVLTLLGSTWCIWRLLHEVSPARVLASLAFFALLLLAKMTAMVIFPITVCLLAVRLIGGTPLRFRWRGQHRTIVTRRAQAAVFAVLVLAHAVAGWSAIWAHYGFRHAASPIAGETPVPASAPAYRDGQPGQFKSLALWARQTGFLPEGYCRGVEWLLGNDDKLPAFMAGKIKLGGWRAFFPYAIWVKTHPTLFVMLLIAGWAWWRSRYAADAGSASRFSESGPGVYALTPHLVLVAVYCGVAVTEDLNLGHRHVLPIYPSLYVLAGATTLMWRKHANVG